MTKQEALILCNEILQKAGIAKFSNSDYPPIIIVNGDITQVSFGDNYSNNTINTNTKDNVNVGDNSLVNSNNNRVKPSGDAVVEQMMVELRELIKALTDAMVANQRTYDRLLAIIERNNLK